MGARLLPQSYQYPNLLEGADRVGIQLHGDKECPFSGVTNSGRGWRKVLEKPFYCCLRKNIVKKMGNIRQVDRPG